MAGWQGSIYCKMLKPQCNENGIEMEIGGWHNIEVGHRMLICSNTPKKNPISCLFGPSEVYRRPQNASRGISYRDFMDRCEKEADPKASRSLW